MKLTYSLILLSMILASCGSTSNTVEASNKKIPNGEKETSENIKDTEKQAATTTSSNQDSNVLLGIQNRKALMHAPYSEWFTENYEAYTSNPEILPMLKPLLAEVTIKAFMGTWCGDSQREVPTLYKILDASDFDYGNLELITVSREKTTPQGLEKGMDIQRVPTFIFYKDGKEIGRYVEYAVTSLEDDMLTILSGGDYKHSYYKD